VVLRIILRLVTDLFALTAFAFRRRRATAAEILVLRRQIALYKDTVRGNPILGGLHHEYFLAPADT
jgi:hypothetical protein